MNSIFIGYKSNTSPTRLSGIRPSLQAKQTPSQPHPFFRNFYFQMKKNKCGCTPCFLQKACHVFCNCCGRPHGSLLCPVHPLRSLHCVCPASQKKIVFKADCFSWAILIPFSSAVAQSNGCRVMARLRVVSGCGAVMVFVGMAMILFFNRCHARKQKTTPAPCCKQ